MGETSRQPESEPGKGNKVIYSLESDTAKLDICKGSEEQGDIITIKNQGTGEQFNLNNFLDDGYKFKFSPNPETRSRVNFEKKSVEVSNRDLPTGNWSSLLIILHEIAHTQNSAENPKEIDRMIELSKKSVETLPKMGMAKLAKEFNELRSADERNAWAKALKMFRTITETLGIKAENLDLSKEDINNLVHGSLQGYKETAGYFAGKYSGEEGEDLRQTISKLYTRKKIVKNK